MTLDETAIQHIPQHPGSNPEPIEWQSSALPLDQLIPLTFWTESSFQFKQNPAMVLLSTGPIRETSPKKRWFGMVALTCKQAS